MAGRDVGIEHGLDLDLLAQRRPQQLGDIGDGGVDVDIARLQRLAPREGEQMLDQFAAALGRLVDQAGVRAAPAGPSGPPPASRWCR